MNESRDTVQANVTYRLGSLGGEEYIECLVCHARSFHPMDILNLYCGHCRAFHRKQYIGAAPVPPGETGADSVLKIARAKLMIAQAARLDRLPSDKPLILAARAVCSAWDSDACVALPRFACLIMDLRDSLGGHGPRDPAGEPPLHASRPTSDAPAAEVRCRVCGCTDENCKECVERTGEPCHWVEPGLCSRCADPKSPEPEAASATEPSGMQSWQCDKCGQINNQAFDYCGSCRKHKPIASPTTSDATAAVREVVASKLPPLCRHCDCFHKPADLCPHLVEGMGPFRKWAEWHLPGKPYRRVELWATGDQSDHRAALSEVLANHEFSEVGSESDHTSDTQADAPQPSPVSAQTGEIHNPPGLGKRLRAAVEGAIETIQRACLGSIGSLNSHYIVQFPVHRLLELRSAFVEQTAAEPAEPAVVKPWTCHVCGALNHRKYSSCWMCYAPPSGYIKTPAAEPAQAGSRKPDASSPPLHEPRITDHDSREPAVMPLASKHKEAIPEARSPEPDASSPPLHASSTTNDAPAGANQ